MTLKDIGTYKNRVATILCENEDVGDIILGNNFNVETAFADLTYKHIFPYLYIDDTQSKQESYICVEVDVPRTMDFTFKQMKVVVWCYCHRGIMQYSKKGYAGTRSDILADAVDRLLNSSNDFGLGRLKLESATPLTSSKEYYGRQLVYSCAEFNIEKKLDR